MARRALADFRSLGGTMAARQEQTIEFRVKVPFDVKQEGRWFVSYCRPLDIHSQGATREEAVKNLAEAIQLFVESCFERGVLDQVLRDCGFHVTHEISQKDEREMLDIHLPLTRNNRANDEAYAC
jgi:predicted RNase H-like HicB family nuclease